MVGNVSLKGKMNSNTSSPGFLTRFSTWLHSITFRTPYSRHALKYNQVVPAVALAGANAQGALAADCASEEVTDGSSSAGTKTP